MATKKRGVVTVLKEATGRKHLRPWRKRRFWKSERQAVKQEQRWEGRMELVKRLRMGRLSGLDPITLGGVEHDSRCLEAADKIEGLEADLIEAVRVAWKCGAHDWVRLNYPAAAASLKKFPPE